MATVQWANTQTNLQGSTIAAGMAGYAHAQMQQSVAVTGRVNGGPGGRVEQQTEQYSTEQLTHDSNAWRLGRVKANEAMERTDEAVSSRGP